MARDRLPFFLLALLTIFLVVAFELSSQLFLRSPVAPGESIAGLGGRYLALLDGILLYSMVTLAVQHLPVRAAAARITAVATLILALLGILLALAMILAAFFKLLLMVGLLLAAPFGTIAYLAVYAAFPKTQALGALSFVMLLKLVFLCLLPLAHQRYLQMKGLLTFIGLSLLATWLTSFLIALPPGFLSSITDALGALITAVIAIVLLIVMFVGSIPAVLRSLRFSAPGREV